MAPKGQQPDAQCSSKHFCIIKLLNIFQAQQVVKRRTKESNYWNLKTRLQLVKNRFELNTMNVMDYNNAVSHVLTHQCVMY
ncbi:hypothetical protein KUTeg_016919 [Tegillarca granosa]|uniref:Uncharacterized protein n=1 Tax=Tegillarca granosa TaxID=220873 RepID=A0ABQ9EN70_TEGGR|nr:hypothetical protein KUTeg_016919 [Tegillarca granosa]